MEIELHPVQYIIQILTHFSRDWCFHIKMMVPAVDYSLQRAAHTQCMAPVPFLARFGLFGWDFTSNGDLPC